MSRLQTTIIAIISIVVIACAITMGVANRSQADGNDRYASTRQNGDYLERRIHLTDGRVITCIVIPGNLAGGWAISCDWGR